MRKMSDTSHFFEYVLYDGAAVITGYTGSARELTVPAQLGGYPVIRIEDRAFWNCSLTEIRFPEGLRSIGDAAFYWGCSLETAHIPASVTYIHEDAFGACSNLRFAVAPGSYAERYAREQGIPVNTVTGSEYEYAPEADGTVGITRYLGKTPDLTIPSYLAGRPVTRIYHSAFADCDFLTCIRIPEGVTAIGEYAFNRCTSLSRVEIPETVTDIGRDAFLRCICLDEFHIAPGNPAYRAEGGALYTADGTTLVCYPGAWGEVTVADGVTTIAPEAFALCKNLTGVKLPDTLTTIGVYAFNWCEKLKSLHLPEGMQTIQNFAFHECSGLKEITLPNTITNIGIHAFRSCTSLKRIRIPGGVRILRDSTFAGCWSLEEVSIPATIRSISGDAFWNCHDDLTLVVSRGSYGEFFARESGMQYLYPDRTFPDQ